MSGEPRESAAPEDHDGVPPAVAAARRRLARVSGGHHQAAAAEAPAAEAPAAEVRAVTGEAASASAVPPGVRARLARADAFDPGRRGVRALAVVAVVVVLVAAGVAWWSQPRPEPVAPPVAGPTRTSGPTVPAELVVAVSGMVAEPGLVRLPPGARVADAIEAAGGVLPDADLAHLNLARKVTDGELIPVGVPPPPGGAGPLGDAPGSGTGAKVDLNTAGQAALETLPGIGPSLAQRIIDYRTEHGSFGSVGELRQVSGIGETRFADLRDLVTV